MLPSEPLTKTQILQTLTEQLDDTVLGRFFPGHNVGDIRRILLEAPAAGGGVPAVAVPPLSPAKTEAIGRCRLFTDGASRGNPGEAGAGVVLFADNGEELATQSVYLGTCTNNVAEYKALLIGLQEAQRLGCTELTIALDSELIVRQIQGRYKVKNETLLVLFNTVREYLTGLSKWAIVHVPRAQNTRAYQLANRGIDQKDNQGYR